LGLIVCTLGVSDSSGLEICFCDVTEGLKRLDEKDGLDGLDVVMSGFLWSDEG